MNPQTILLSVSETGRVFGLDQQTLIQIGIQLVNVSVLAFILSKLLYNPVRNFMKQRSDRIKAQMDRAENDMSQANEIKLQYEKKLEDIESERTDILDSARKLAADKTRQVLAEAKNEADATRARASADIQNEQERVKDEMRQCIIEVSAAMAGKFVTRTIDAETHNKLFDETVEELEKTNWQINEIMAEAEEMTWQN